MRLGQIFRRLTAQRRLHQSLAEVGLLALALAPTIRCCPACAAAIHGCSDCRLWYCTDGSDILYAPRHHRLCSPSDSTCASVDSDNHCTDDNDIILCDGPCNRAYHVKVRPWLLELARPL